MDRDSIIKVLTNCREVVTFLLPDKSDWISLIKVSTDLRRASDRINQHLFTNCQHLTDVKSQKSFIHYCCSGRDSPLFDAIDARKKELIIGQRTHSSTASGELPPFLTQATHERFLLHREEKTTKSARLRTMKKSW